MKSTKTYLKLGAGNACAGHNNANEVSAFLMIVCEMESEENLGPVLP